MKTTFLNGDKAFKQRAKDYMKSRIEDFKYFMGLDDLETSDDEHGSFYNYGLSIDYQEPEGRKRGYFRYQLSWGGQSDEIRFYFDGHVCDKIEYVFLDWGTGAGFDVTNEEWAKWLWDWFDGCDSPNYEREKVMSEI
jgi:hypothetical protein